VRLRGGLGSGTVPIGRGAAHDARRWGRWGSRAPAGGGPPAGRRRSGAPADDLAFAVAHQWYPERRRRLEGRALRHYHAALLRFGVAAYDWRACWDDYRLSVALSIFKPVRFWAINVPALIWWPQLERVMLAFEDLDCVDLL
jgi:hypothetical protein